MSDELRASGGLCAPSSLFAAPPRRGDLIYVTYQVRGRLRRWWLRRDGWSTEWTVEYEYVPIIDLIPTFTATRGGVRM